MKKFDYKAKDWFILMAAFAGVLKIFLSVWFNIEVTQEKIDALINLVAFIVILVVIPANTYVTKKRQEEKKLLDEQKK